MIRRGVATFTLDTGTCPRWLFERMVRLGKEMIRTIILEYSPEELVARLSDPVWFQSLGTVLAFDWNASGLTTILTAAIKEAIRGEEKDLGFFACGGKGKTSLKTPLEIIQWRDRLSLPDSTATSLVYNSKMAAKVDSCLVQDNYQIYHHAFFFTANGAWTVVQQGMNKTNKTARRYHWFSEKISDIVCEPHTAISSPLIGECLDLTSRKSGSTRNISAEMVQGPYNSLMKDISIIRKYSSNLSKMIALTYQQQELVFAKLAPVEFHRHPVMFENFSKSSYLEKIIAKVCDIQPESYERLLSIEGVGPKTIRALSLVSEVIYGATPSYEDPARYSFALGGKDATPYPVDRATYDKTIHFFQEIVLKMKASNSEKKAMMQKLQ